MSALEGEPLIEVLERVKSEVAYVCCHPKLEPIQTRDTCLALLGKINDREMRHGLYTVLILLEGLGTHFHTSRTCCKKTFYDRACDVPSLLLSA